MDWFLQVKGNRGFDAYYLDAAYKQFVHVGYVTDETNPALATIQQTFDDLSINTAMFNDLNPNGTQTSSLAH